MAAALASRLPVEPEAGEEVSDRIGRTLSPELEKFYRQHADIKVVMISAAACVVLSSERSG